MKQLTLAERDRIGQLKATNEIIEQYEKKALVLTEMLEEANDAILIFQMRKRNIINGN